MDLSDSEDQDLYFDAAIDQPDDNPDSATSATQQFEVYFTNTLPLDPVASSAASTWTSEIDSAAAPLQSGQSEDDTATDAFATSLFDTATSERTIYETAPALSPISTSVVFFQSSPSVTFESAAAEFVQSPLSVSSDSTVTSASIVNSDFELSGESEDRSALTGVSHSSDSEDEARQDGESALSSLTGSDSSDSRLLQTAGANVNMFVDQRRRNIGIRHLYNFIRQRRALVRNTDRIREVDDSNIPQLSVDLIQNMTYDISLPDRHEYLASDLEIMSGRTVHEDEQVLVLPFIRQSQHVLLPKQSMPM